MFPQPYEYKAHQFCIEGTSKEDVEEKILELFNQFITTYGKNNVKVMKREYIPVKNKDGKITKYIIKGNFIFKTDIELSGHKYDVKSLKPKFDVDLTDLDRKIC